MVKKVTLTTRDFESEFALASLQSLILSNKAWQVYTKHPSPLGRKDGEEEDDEVDQDEDRPFLGFKTQAMKCEASPKASHRQFDSRSEIFFTPGFGLSLDQKVQYGNRPRRPNALYQMIFCDILGIPANEGKMQIETKYIWINPN